MGLLQERREFRAMVRKKETLLVRYRHWKFRNSKYLDGLYTGLWLYSWLFLLAVLASADTICNRWIPVCIGWFD